MQPEDARHMLNEIDYNLQSAFKVGRDGILLWFPNIFWGKGYAVADKERLERVLGYLYITVPLRAQSIGIVLMCFLVGYLFFRNPIILKRNGGVTNSARLVAI